MIEREGLKVGDVARRTGLTVRTLHHLDELGLVRPSARSPSGHRLSALAVLEIAGRAVKDLES